MEIKILKIYKNAKKSLSKDINGNDKKWKIQSFVVTVLFPILSGFIVYNNQDNFIDDPKILGTLLSLFSGLMFGVLIKIPDKFKEIEAKKFDTKEDTIKKKQRKN
ncbi:MAG TPA: hypothetical protein VF676_07025 [Flavobacterium sp.]|jgi:hypothetical protein